MKTIQNHTKNDYLKFEVQTCLDQISQHLLKRHIKHITYNQRSLNNFSTLPIKKQQSIIDNIKKYLNIINKSISNENLTKDEEIQCLKDALSEYNLKVKDDNFDFIDQSDIVEIYNHENIQIYRNFQFLKVNPYDLLTILTVEWQHLYERSSLVTKNIHNKITEVINSDIVSHVPFDIPIHSMKAVAKDEQVVVSIRLKNIKPVFNKNITKKVAFIATQYNSPILLEGANTDSVLILNHKNR